MTNKYSIVKLDRKDIEDFINENREKLEYLHGLSSVNVFIGSNNTGKSRFLRSILKTQDIKYFCLGTEEEKIYSELEIIDKEIREVESQNDSVSSIKIKGNSFELNGSLLKCPDMFIIDGTENSEIIKKYKNTYEMFLLPSQYIQMGSRGGGKGNLMILENQLRGILNSHKDILQSIDKIIIKQGHFKKYYIPTLRGLNNFASIVSSREDFFKERILLNYNINETNSKVITFTGLDLYERIKKMLLGELRERKRIKDFENFLSKEIFNNKEITLMPRIDSNLEVLYVKIGDENERPIYELGDGIQSIIVLTFPLFEIEQGLFFIEEPEMHLHPGMQRKLLEVFRTRKNHQYFITTHSNHFLDLTLDYEDVSLYTFKKQVEDNKVEIKLVSPGDETMLQLLGAQNTSVFLSNATIWVEGITDRLYIRKYLEIYQNDKKEKVVEDIDYSFVEYGGDNITHWSFLDKEEYPIDIEKLCGKSILITDEDGNKNIQRKKELKASLGTRYKLLDCKEIENTLAFEVVGKVIQDYESKNKNQDFIMPPLSSRKTFKKQGLGRFIDNEVFTNQICKRRGGYGTETGTIKDKVEFCKKSLVYINKENMTEEAINLAKFIYNFVIKQKHSRIS